MSKKATFDVDEESRQLYQRGQDLLDKARETNDRTILQEAEQIFHTVLNRYPQSIAGIFYLGCVHLLYENEGLAQVLFSVVYKADKDFINAANNLGILYKNREWRKQASAIYFDAIETMETRGREIFPDEDHYKDVLADLYSNLGSCFTNNGTPDQALEYYHKSLSLKDRLDRDTPRFNMALAYLEKGDYKNGWDNYHYYGVVHPERRRKNYHTDDNPTPKWTGDKTKVVAVLGEQGLGDELMFATILPDMMEEVRVIFDCHPRLQSMFKRAWPNAPVFGTRKDQNSVWQAMLQPDEYIPLSETAYYYRQKLEDFPGDAYLTPDENLMERLPDWLNKEKKRPRIGISWTGGLPKTNTAFRTIPMGKLIDLFQNDCDFVSLQYKPEHNKQLKTLCDSHGIENVHIYQDIVDDYELTACLLDRLDFIICAPQSVVFLAGALGVTCYQLCPKRGMWQQGVYGHDMPWFKSVKNFWQSDFDNWDEPINKSKQVIHDAINNG